MSLGVGPRLRCNLLSPAASFCPARAAVSSSPASSKEAPHSERAFTLDVLAATDGARCCPDAVGVSRTQRCCCSRPRYSRRPPCSSLAAWGALPLSSSAARRRLSGTDVGRRRRRRLRPTLTSREIDDDKDLRVMSFFITAHALRSLI